MKQKTLFMMLLISALSIFTACDDNEDDSQSGKEQNKPEQEVVETPSSVDLGLSVRWATFNVGATKPVDFGWSVAWGETSKSDSYDWAMYLKDFGGSMAQSQDAGSTKDPLSLYVAGGSKTTETIKGTEYDVARVKLSNVWRMPSKEEFLELSANCTWKWYAKGNDEFQGVAGYKVTSNVAGYTDNYIFLPAAGASDKEILSDTCSLGKYWSASSAESDADCAIGLYFDSSKVEPNALSERCLGFSIRPVTELTQYDKALSFKNTYSDVLALTVEDVTPEDKDAIDAVLAVYSKLEESIQALLSAQKALLDALKEDISSYHEGVKYVQLWADGPRWATCNLGAAKPEEIGQYFAWGETKTKKDFSWVSYLSDLGGAMTKPQDAGRDRDPLAEYVYNGSLFEQTIKGTQYDAARAILGGEWRMPTKEEFTLLSENCTWEWFGADNTKFNGVQGYKVSSKVEGQTYKYIFLPVSGFIDEYQMIHNEWMGFYWSASPCEQGPESACILRFEKSEIQGIYTELFAYRYNGLLIRPVID